MLQTYKNASHYTGGLAAWMRPGAGQVFYVEGFNGVNTNDGLTPDTPLLTITEALDRCTANADDYILLIDYWTAAGEAWPIVVNKGKVHIVGVHGGGSNWISVQPGIDTASFSVTALDAEIANISCHAGANHAGIELAGTAWGVHIRNCWFGVTGGCRDGIEDLAPIDMPYLLIEGCRFGQSCTRDGVRISHNATRGLIGNPYTGVGNLFDRCAGIGVNLSGNTSEIGIFNNVFHRVDDTQGNAITLSAGGSNQMVDGNSAFWGNAAANTNPYDDGAAANVNHWGLNYENGVYTLPA